MRAHGTNKCPHCRARIAQAEPQDSFPDQYPLYSRFCVEVNNTLARARTPTSAVGWMAFAPARTGDWSKELLLTAHLESQLSFIKGNLVKLDRNASNGRLTADETQELGFCERMFEAVRPFKNADIDLQNAKLF